MKRCYWFWVVSLILGFVSDIPAQTRYILRAPAEAVEDVARRNGFKVKKPLLSKPGNALFLVTAPEDIPPGQVIASAKRDPKVLNIELDAAAYLPETTDSADALDQSTVAILDALANPEQLNYFGASSWAGYVFQPAAAIIGLPQALTFGSGAATIAVIDTGVDPNHAALRNSLAPGYDFINNQPGGSELADLDQSTVAILDQADASVIDDVPVEVNQSTVAILDQSTVAILDGANLPPAFGHGTMVSGLIHLVSPGSKIMPLKAFRSDGTGYLSDIIRAIYYAVDNGAKAINMSFSMPVSSTELQAAISYANSGRVICLASAGNSGLQTLVYPAAYQKVIGNASTSQNDVRSRFSNYGDLLVTTAAPGEALITTYPFNSYAAVWGTSFSVALNSGGVGLLAQIDPRINQAQAVDAFSKAYPIPNQGLGFGRIDLYRACNFWWKSTH
jgi:subtilisin family serine protease